MVCGLLSKIDGNGDKRLSTPSLKFIQEIYIFNFNLTNLAFYYFFLVYSITNGMK